MIAGYGKSRILVLALVFCFSENLAAQEIEKENQDIERRIGVGLGIPYGGLGLNFEFSNNNLGGFFGAGLLVNYFGFGAGAHYYFLDPENPARPRITALIGTVGIKVEETWFGEEEEKGTVIGAGFGLGGKLRASENVDLDLDILFLTPTGNVEGGEVQNNVVFSAGAGYSW